MPNPGWGCLRECSGVQRSGVGSLGVGSWEEISEKNFYPTPKKPSKKELHTKQKIATFETEHSEAIYFKAI